MKEGNSRDELDILLKIERLMGDINNRMSSKNQFIVKRYPLTFAILVLFGVVAVSEGIKGILDKVSFFENSPFHLLFIGLFLLVVLGSVYKKLDK